MRDVNIKPAAAWNLLLIVSLAAIAFVAWIQFGTQKQVAGLGAGQGSVSTINSKTAGTEASATVALHNVKARSWDLNAEVLGSHVLETLNRLSDKNHLQVAGFRVGRVTPAADLQEAPFTAVVEGGFMDIMNLVKSLEQPDSKVVISLLKVSSDSGSDHVTATLGLTGFLFKEGP